MFTMVMRFLSPSRFWRNLWTHFPIPMGVCIILALSHFLFGLIWESNLIFGLLTALNFSTAASCIRRRFDTPLNTVWAAAALGLLLGLLTAESNATWWLLALSLAVCVIVSCWTRRFYLQLLFVVGWFALCLAITWWLEIAAISVFRSAFLMLAIPFTIAPYLFLGGLPFGDEAFRA